MAGFLSIAGMKGFFLTLFCIQFLMLILARPSYAWNKVSSPDVVGGRTELEYRGGYDVDDRVGVQGQNQHRFVANHGITDRWRVEVKNILVQTDTTSRWTFSELSNRYQIIKDDSDWLPKLSIQGNYKFALRQNAADKFESTLLLSKTLGPFANIINLNAERDIGRFAAPGTNLVFSYKNEYLYNDYLEPGFEYYAELSKVGGPKTSGPKRHFLGPMISGKLLKDVKYDTGVLFGVSDAAPTARFKWILTYQL